MFKWWDPVYYWYRNDIESVSVRKGCTFTGFDDSSLNGGSFTIRSGSAKDTWVRIQRWDSEPEPHVVMFQPCDSFWRGRVRGLRRENPVHLLCVQRLKTNIQIQWMSKYWEIRSRKSWLDSWLLKYLKIKMRFLVTLSVFLYDAKLWVFIKWLSYCLEIFCKQ